jgi:hypothetical protein
MPGYKHPCRYCDTLVSEDARVCPACGKINPVGTLRCPKCKSPVEKGWKKCSNCGLVLELTCAKCGKTTFFGDYCENCGSVLSVVCPNPKCKLEQPPIGDKCVKCGRPLKKEG